MEKGGPAGRHQEHVEGTIAALIKPIGIVFAIAGVLSLALGTASGALGAVAICVAIGGGTAAAVFADRILQRVEGDLNGTNGRLHLEAANTTSTSIDDLGKLPTPTCTARSTRDGAIPSKER